MFQQDTTQMLVSEVWNWAVGRSRGWRLPGQSWKNLRSFCWMRWGCTDEEPASSGPRIRDFFHWAAFLCVLEHLFFGAPGHFFTGHSDWAEHSSIPRWNLLQQDDNRGRAQVTLLNFKWKKKKTAQLFLHLRISCVLSEWYRTLQQR